MRNVMVRAMSVAVSVVGGAVLAGVTCYEEFGPQPLACQVVVPPASPVAPFCTAETVNEQVHNTLAVSLGYYYNNPVPYSCGYVKGRYYNGPDCYNLNEYITVPYWGYTATGPGCSNPE